MIDPLAQFLSESAKTTTKPEPEGPPVGMWTRSNGQAVSMADMNPFHRKAAIAKARKDGNDILAAELEASGPTE